MGSVIWLNKTRVIVTERTLLLEVSDPWNDAGNWLLWLPKGGAKAPWLAPLQFSPLLLCRHAATTALCFWSRGFGFFLCLAHHISFLLSFVVTFPGPRERLVQIYRIYFSKLSASSPKH